MARAQKRSLFFKLNMGGTILVCVLFIIWFPFFIMTFSQVGDFDTNKPEKCLLSVQIGKYKVLHIPN